MKNKIIYSIVLVAMAISFTACKKEYIDPTRVPDSQAISTAQGMTSILNGVQRVYTAGRGSSLYNFITINGLLTRELFVVNTGNTAEVLLQTGGASVDGQNTVLATFWSTSNKIVYETDRVLAAAQGLGDKNVASGIIGFATIYKAMALGHMSQFWEKVPNGTGTNVSFIDRNVGYQNAITAINAALAQISSFPIASSFANSIPPGVDIVNTLQALKARYSLASGNYTQALSAANAVDLTKKSTFAFDALTFNPVFEVATSTNNVVQVIDSSFGLPAGIQTIPNDARVGFHMSLNATVAPRWRINGFYNSTTAVIPFYLPSEMTLIKAECYLRASMPDIPNATIELNKILTKTAGSDPFGIGANQPAYSGALTVTAMLDEVYKQRCVELYMSGLKIEDMRRFGRANSERKRNLLPYPFRERDNNPNTPADPAF
jgi:starch-binding outer membrane protein, SusD/RagB family